MSKIINLHQVEEGAIDHVAAVGAVNPEVVGQLRKILEMAETGKLKGFAIGLVTSDGAVMTGHAPYTSLGAAGKAEMIGAVTSLQYYLVAVGGAEANQS